MEDAIKKLFLCAVFLISSCTPYQKIGGLYGKGRFVEAYTLLQKENPDSPKHRLFELKVVFHLVLDGDNNYLSLLEELLLFPPPPGGEEIQRFASAWVLFLAAQSPDDFKKVLEALPAAPLEESSLERTRMAVQNQSLLKLERYQEAVHNLDGKTARNPDLVYLLASAYKGLNKTAEAELLYRETIKLSKDAVLKGLSYFHTAELLEQAQNAEEARKAYLASWDLAADNAVLNFKLGRLLAQEAYETLPQRFYRAALRMDENHAEAWYYLNL